MKTIIVLIMVLLASPVLAMQAESPQCKIDNVWTDCPEANGDIAKLKSRIEYLEYQVDQIMEAVNNDHSLLIGVSGIVYLLHPSEIDAMAKEAQE